MSAVNVRLREVMDGGQTDQWSARVMAERGGEGNAR